MQNSQDIFGSGLCIFQIRSEPRHENYRDVRSRLIFAQAPTNFIASQIGQQIIEQDQIRFLLASRLQSLLRRSGGDHVIICFGQNLLDET